MLPFARFAGADSVLGPEMKSTGEVMGIATDFPTAFGKAQEAAGVSLPSEGAVFITVTDTDKPAATQLATRFHDMGFEVIATGGTAQSITSMGVPVTRINKLSEGSPNAIDLLRERRCDLVINTPTGSGARADGHAIRTAAVRHGIPCVTTMTGASAAVRAIAARMEEDAEVLSLQEIHKHSAASSLRGCLSAARPPFGRRLCEVVEAHDSGGYRVFSLRDEEGPPPLAGQFYMLAAGRHWEQDGRRPYLPRALSVADSVDEDGARRLDFLIEGIGPGTDRLCELEAGDTVWVNGPLGNSFSEPRRLDPGGRRGDPRRRRHRHRPAGAPAAGLLRPRASRPGSCSGSATASTPAASTTSSPAARSASRARTATPATPATSPTCWRRCSRATTRPAPSSTPAARRRCSTPSTSSAPIAASPRSSPTRPRWPAATAPATAAPSPTPTATATSASA